MNRWGIVAGLLTLLACGETWALESMTSVQILTSQTFSGATALPQGTRIVLLLPADGSMLQFARLSYTMGGTTPTSTVTAELQPGNMIDQQYSYPKNYTIS